MGWSGLRCRPWVQAPVPEKKQTKNKPSKKQINLKISLLSVPTQPLLFSLNFMSFWALEENNLICVYGY
jgi:hypothetical protein